MVKRAAEISTEASRPERVAMRAGIASMRPSPSSAARSRHAVARVVPEAELVGGAADHLLGGVAGEPR